MISKNKILCIIHGVQYKSKHPIISCRKCYNEKIKTLKKEYLKTLFVDCEIHGRQNIFSLSNRTCKKCYNGEKRKFNKPEKRYIYCYIHGRQLYRSKARNNCKLCGDFDMIR